MFRTQDAFWKNSESSSRNKIRGPFVLYLRILSSLFIMSILFLLFECYHILNKIGGFLLMSMTTLGRVVIKKSADKYGSNSVTTCPWCFPLDIYIEISSNFHPPVYVYHISKTGGKVQKSALWCVLSIYQSQLVPLAYWTCPSEVCQDRIDYWIWSVDNLFRGIDVSS